MNEEAVTQRGGHTAAKRRRRCAAELADALLRLDMRWKDKNGTGFTSITIDEMAWSNIINLAQRASGLEGRNAR